MLTLFTVLIGLFLIFSVWIAAPVWFLLEKILKVIIDAVFYLILILFVACKEIFNAVKNRRKREKVENSDKK